MSGLAAFARTYAGGMTVNGLVVGSGNFFGDQVSRDALADLEIYYRENGIRGPVAFVEVAENYDDYAKAMERKLLRELSALAVGQIDKKRGADG